MSYEIYEIRKHVGWNGDGEIISHANARSLMECNDLVEYMSKRLPKTGILSHNAQFLTMKRK